jgi:glycosyltransferase involved in cell wall biosynthesis
MQTFSTRILIIANYLPGNGGIASVVANHIHFLRKNNHLVTVFSTKKNIARRILMPLQLIFLSRKFNVVHIHGCSWMGFFPIVIGIIACKIIHNKKTIITYHGGGFKDFYLKRGKIIKWFLNKADQVTVMSEYLQNIFSNYGINTHILRNMINIEIKSHSYKEFQTPIILSIRSLTFNYNIEDIIYSFMDVKKKYPNAKLKIAGTGDKQNLLKGLSNDVEGIEFLGLLSKEEVYEQFIKCNIFISVPTKDNQPMSILESFAFGVPVISTRTGGVVDMIKHRFNGFLVEVNNPDQITESVVWIMNNHVKVKQIALNAANELVKYEEAVVGSELLKLYS